jgi:hypothetical protein
MFFYVRISHVLYFISICDLFTDFPSYVHSNESRGIRVLTSDGRNILSLSKGII